MAATSIRIGNGCGFWGDNRDAPVLLAESGRQPINSLQASQFIASCQDSAAGANIDCQCFLNQVEADGYDTPDALNNLMGEAQSEEAAGRVGPYRTTLRTALLACRL